MHMAMELFTSNDGFEYKGNFNEGKYDYDGNMRYTRSADFIGNEGELYNNGIERGPIKLFDPPLLKNNNYFSFINKFIVG